MGIEKRIIQLMDEKDIDINNLNAIKVESGTETLRNGSSIELNSEEIRSMKINVLTNLGYDEDEEGLLDMTDEELDNMLSAEGISVDDLINAHLGDTEEFSENDLSEDNEFDEGSEFDREDLIVSILDISDEFSREDLEQIGTEDLAEILEELSGESESESDYDLEEDFDSLEDIEATKDSNEILEVMENLEGDELEYSEEVFFDAKGNPVEVEYTGEIVTKRIPMDDILIIPSNRRNLIDDVSDLEMSILKWGQIEPVQVVPYSKGKYLLFHGIRRYQALMNLNAESIICSIHLTRPHATARYLNVICNNSKKFDFLEIIRIGEFIESKQNFRYDTIENMIGLEKGDYLKALFIKNEDRYGVTEQIIRGRKTISEGFKKVENELRKEKEAQDPLDDIGYDELPDHYKEEELLSKIDGGNDEDKMIITDAMAERVITRDEEHCQSCGIGYEKPELSGLLEVIPILSKKMGGEAVENNLITVCANCRRVVESVEENKFNPPSERVGYYINAMILGEMRNNPAFLEKNPYKEFLFKSEQVWRE